MSSADTRSKEQQKARAAKKAAMFENGEKSRYLKRKKARKRGEPMDDRSGERAPWWTRWPVSIMSAFTERTPAAERAAA